MKIQPLKILSKDEIQLIHENTLELLQTLGVRVESEEAQNLLVKNGATSVNRDNKIYILFPEDLVKEQLKKV
ncbi:MAG: trimethylamine methyltransferase family protein [Promethearchaeota archaeon]